MMATKRTQHHTSLLPATARATVHVCDLCILVAIFTLTADTKAA